MNVADHYTYRVHWSAEDDAYVGTVAEMPSLSWIADDQDDAFVGIRTLCVEAVDDMLADGETPPAPLADREYSGKFVVRVPPEAHRLLVIEAAEQNVSLNRLAVSRLVRA
ncbi:MAG: type II toxin-antitoxin system HicB family antitoxin [Propionibacteriaceae bacterium]|jgi:predicted HicB family RNase H-like nuclease|nr:type II toxin-antitoxin system HicB family antitoxin [Propionibacteriaceae bacterium]